MNVFTTTDQARRGEPAAVIDYVGDRLLPLKEVLYVMGISRSSLYNYIANGSAPRQVKIGPRRIGFRASDIRQWLAERKDARG